MALTHGRPGEWEACPGRRRDRTWLDRQQHQRRRKQGWVWLQRWGPRMAQEEAGGEEVCCWAWLVRGQQEGGQGQCWEVLGAVQPQHRWQGGAASPLELTLELALGVSLVSLIGSSDSVLTDPLDLVESCLRRVPDSLGSVNCVVLLT